MKTAKIMGEKGKKFKKFHFRLNVALILSFLIIAFYHATEGQNIIVMLLVIPAIIVITVAMFFGMFALVYHVIEKSGWEYVFMAAMNSSLLPLTASIAFIQNSLWLLFVKSFFILGHIFIAGYILIKSRKSEKQDREAIAKADHNQARSLGILLTGLLALIIVGDAVLVMASPFIYAYSTFQGWTFYATIALSFIDLISAIALLTFRRWGFYGLVTARTAGLAFNLFLIRDSSYKTGSLLSLIVSIGLTILIIKLVMDRWKQFENKRMARI